MSTADQEGPWTKYAVALPDAKPWEKYKPQGGIQAGLKGAIKGAYERAKDVAASNPFALTDEQAGHILELPNNRLLRAAAMVPFQAANVFNYGVGLAAEAASGALGGGIAGYEGAVPSEARNITGQTGRTVSGVIESEIGRAGEPHGAPPWEKFRSEVDNTEKISSALRHIETISKTDQELFEKPWEKYRPSSVQSEVGSAHALTPEAQPVGAAVSPTPAPLPERPTRAMISDQEDRFFRLKGAATADRAEFLQRVEALPEALKSPEVQQKLYRYMEGDPQVKLTPEERAAYEEHIAPLKREERDLFEELKKRDLDVAEYDPSYVHRIVKGRGSVFDPYAGDASGSTPIGGSRRVPPSTKDRVYYAIENPEGTRKIVAIKDGTIGLANKGEKFEPLKKVTMPNRIAPEEGIMIDGKRWIIKNALTREIEDVTDTQYHKNAVANTIDNVARLRAATRAVYETERLKASPEFATYAKKADEKDIPAHWISTNMPLFRGYRMDPKLAHAIDDFYGRDRGNLHEALSKINRFAVTSLFWSPIPHARNAAAHWFTARGWDWITPRGVKSLALDSARAMGEVIKQGPKYQELLREGSGLVYGGLANKDFYDVMMKRPGEDVKIHTNKWDPIAKVLGVGPTTLVNMMYNGSARALWSISDMFMMQRVLELERKGMSTRAAIKDAERHIPNYRIPSEVLNSRSVNEALTNPLLTEFSRYHYGMLKSYAHMAKDLAVGTMEQKKDAIGSIMATAFLMTVVWPVINYGIQKVTGNKSLELSPSGSTTVPQALLDLWNGDKGFTEVLSNMVTMAPVLRAGVETYANYDLFTGKHIREPADERKHRFGRLAAQQAEYLAEHLVQPYGMFAQAEHSGTGLLKAILKQGLGLRSAGPDQEAKKQKAFRYQEQEAARRAKKPRGPIERSAYEAGL